MTFKHISFTDSSVMRELERHAIKQRTFPIQVIDLVKQASLQPKYAASINLYHDLFILANGLRQLGFKKEAVILEDKIIICKQAETHLYRAIDEDGEDLLEFAHPHGDSHVADAKDNLGDVETTLSTHQKIIDVLNKQPSGKTALYLSGIKDLFKVAQETTSDDAELPDDVVLDEVQLKKVAAINEYLSQNWPIVGSQIKSAIATTNMEFNSSTLLTSGTNSNYVNFFVSQAKISSSDLNSLINNWNYLYSGATTANGAVIQAKLAKLERTAMYNFVNSIDTNIARTYFTGVNWMAGIPANIYNEHINEHPEDFYNANSVFSAKYTSLGNTSIGMTHSVNVNQQSLAIASEKLHEVMLDRFNKLIDSKIPEASKTVMSEVNKLLSNLNSLLTSEGSVNLNTVPQIKTSTSFITIAMVNYLNILDQYSKNGERGKSLNLIFDNMTPAGAENTGTFFGYIKDAQTAAKNISDYLSQPENAISKRDLIPPKDTYVAIANNFRLAAKRLNNHIGKLRESGIDEKSKDFIKYFNRLRRAATIYKTVASATNKPYGAISDTILKMFPKATTPELLLKESESWVKGTEPLETKASSNSNVRKKVADYGDEEGGSKPQAAGNPATNPKANTTLSPREKDAVQGMQLALFTLGQYLNTYGESKIPSLGAQIPSLVGNLMRTGKGLKDKATKNQFDGVWGSNTAAALMAGQTVIVAWNSKNPNKTVAQVQQGPMMGQDDKSTTSAISNTNIISQLIRFIFGAQTGQNIDQEGGDVELDGLPQRSDLTTTGNPETAINDGSGIKLKLSDLKNLNSLYNFLISNGLETPEQAGASETNIGYEGFSIRKWNGIIQWFKKRAVFKYNLFGRQDRGLEDYRQNAKTYYNGLVNLENQYKSLFTSLLSNTRDKQNFGSYVVPEGLIAQVNQRGGSGRMSGSGDSNTTGAMFGGERGRRGRVSSTEGDQYAGWRGDGGSEGRSVNMPPTETSEGSPIGERLNLERLGILDNSIVYPIISFNQFRANAIDLANSLVNETEAGMPAVHKFQQFLVSLYRAIQSSAAEWSRSGDATEEEVEASSKWSNAWAQMIRKKLDQIKRWKTSGTR